MPSLKVEPPSPRCGRLSQSEQQVEPSRRLVTACARNRRIRARDQRVGLLRPLVTQGRRAGACANSRDGATARPSPGRRSAGRESSHGFRAWRASGPGWRLCWPPCRRGRNSNSGDGGCAGPDGIASDSTYTYGGPCEPSRPLLRGRIIGQGNACRSHCLNGPHAPPLAVPERSIRWAGYGFKPLEDFQPDADTDRDEAQIRAWSGRKLTFE